MNRPGFRKNVVKYRTMLLMLTPGVLLTFVFAYVPMPGVILAFKNYNYSGGIFGSPWSGLDNFRYFFTSGDAWRVTRNTGLYNIAFIVVNNLLQITVAILMFELSKKWFRKIAQTLLFLPYFISWVVVGAIAYNFLSYKFGLLNSTLRIFGIESIDVYNTPAYWPFLLVFIMAWKTVGYGSILYLAAITGIDTEMYEAAEIDGANVWQRIMKITVPSLYPTIIILILLALGNIFRGDFGLFYNVVGNNGLLFGTTDVIDTYVFRSLMVANDIGISAAAGFYQSILGFFTVITANYLVRKYNKDYALF
ncbi:ABC transporter permease [Paenibacillus alkalitolerans]|uniref:ABC transporter permease n=1 Tax=Paenibacillus alkalitolerans TaxID=2799335 RepID=UPI0018F7351A|nr:ABC transporter permease subunit [Paenibacillus alkalitolerans]